LIRLNPEDTFAMNLELKLVTRVGRWVAAALPAAVVVLVLAGGGLTSAAAAKTPPIDAPCQQVAAVLSDGPDPGVDPVGYAQAQIIQLRKLKLSNRKLGTTVRTLATAYASYAKSNGASKPAKTAVKKAERAVNAICPGAAQ
jgi:hypothetical protein